MHIFPKITSGLSPFFDSAITKSSFGNFLKGRFSPILGVVSVNAIVFLVFLYSWWVWIAKYWPELNTLLAVFGVGFSLVKCFSVNSLVCLILDRF